MVVGEGRCGSSAVSGILHHLGVFMGKSFIEADAGNIWGYWEDAEFHKVCMSVWDTLQYSFVSEKDKKGLTEWREKLMRLVGERKTLGKPWGFKNPRMANAPEFFFSCFDKPIIIRCKRNDEDAIKSFVKAYLTELDEENARYWYNFRKKNLDEALKNREHLEIRFEDLISKKEETVKKIADYVGLPVKQEAVDFIKDEKELVSVVMPCHSRPDLTRVALDSIIKYTEAKYELIIVQEGENEELNKLLKAYDVKFVHNRKPKGFAGAMNSGLEIAEGKYVCFINNDIVAIPNWLESMIEVFEKDEKIGLVSPTYTEAKKRPQNVDANNGEEITYIENPLELKGVCFMVRKEVMDKVGKWDESFEMGGGEDNDLALRIKKAGYNLAVARRSYLYHYGSATFREVFNNDIDYSKKYAVQQFNKFRKKHMPNEKPSVFISVPCYDGKINYELSLRLIQWSHDPNFTCTIKFYPYLAPLDNARNLAVKDFLEGYWTHFFHTDSDIIPPENCITELLKADKDVIAPLCFTIQHDDDNIPFTIPVAMRYDENKQYRPYYGKEIEEVDAMTGGAFLVKREVFEKLERPFYFTYHKSGIVEYSEDFVFSQQCQKLGYKLFTHFGLHTKHIREVDCKAVNDLCIKIQNEKK
ncbi:MAG: glycosyltransferase [Candidatus Heimdallarchaeota archaeon]